MCLGRETLLRFIVPAYIPICRYQSSYMRFCESKKAGGNSMGVLSRSLCIPLIAQLIVRLITVRTLQ